MGLIVNRLDYGPLKDDGQIMLRNFQVNKGSKESNIEKHGGQRSPIKSTQQWMCLSTKNPQKTTRGKILKISRTDFKREADKRFANKGLLTSS